MSAMNTGISQSAVIANIDVHQSTEMVEQTRPVSPAQVTTQATKLVMVLASVGMMYGFIHYGRIFENYLRW